MIFFLVFSKYAVICSLGASDAGGGLYVVNNFVFLKPGIFCYSCNTHISHSSDPITLSLSFLTLIFPSSVCHSIQSLSFSSPLIHSVEELPALQATKPAERPPGDIVPVLLLSCVTIDCKGICKAVAFTQTRFGLLCIWPHTKKLFGGCIDLC